jgi:hypothetical protein
MPHHVPPLEIEKERRGPELAKMMMRGLLSLVVLLSRP